MILLFQTHPEQKRSLSKKVRNNIEKRIPTFWYILMVSHISIFCLYVEGNWHWNQHAWWLQPLAAPKIPRRHVWYVLHHGCRPRVCAHFSLLDQRWGPNEGVVPNQKLDPRIPGFIQHIASFSAPSNVARVRHSSEATQVKAHLWSSDASCHMDPYGRYCSLPEKLWDDF